MKRVPMVIGIMVCALLYMYGVTAQVIYRHPSEPNKGPVVKLTIDGSQKFQQIDGFGVNINTRSWDGNRLEPALDLLLDSLHATLWRVIVETVENWEDVNDNADPFVFNWDYYNRLYRTPKFQKAFNTIRYLNQRGITGNLMINFMGRIPLWIGGEIVKPEMEDEYIEMLVSFFYYARFTEHLQFGLISPMNEPDMRKEGPSMGGDQYVRLLRKLMDRMQANGMGDVRYVAPDAASMYKSIEEYLPVLLKDSAVMSRVAHLGLHSYGGYYADVKGFLKRSGSNLPGSHSSGSSSPNFWVTEWNSWRDGLDDGRIGVYDFPFSSECMYKLLQLIQHGASAGLAYEGYDSYYEHHVPSLFSYWGILGYDSLNKAYAPRKHFYAISQLSRFVLPGSFRIGLSQQKRNPEPDNKPNHEILYRGNLTTDNDDSYLKDLPPGEGLRKGDSLIVLAFRDTSAHRLTIVGVNRGVSAVILENKLNGLPGIHHFDLYFTSSTNDLHKDKEVKVSGNIVRTTIPPDCIFTLVGEEKPEPSGWYAGDIHVHRNCGDGTAVFGEEQLSSMMEPNDLAVISLLADNGNGEVKDSRTDLPKVDGRDAAASKPGRIIHWDAEWHWDATYSNFNHEALGGHLVLLGLKGAHQIWNESTYKILEESRHQNAVSGFAHMEYLNDSIQNELNCCIPIDYPVEAALGTIDFVSEDVFSRNIANNGTYYSDGALKAYYRLLNCGFRIGLAAGTDYPCNYLEPLGSLLTYVNVKDGLLTYRKWIDGIKEGRTVISRNGHNEFLDMVVNGNAGPGDVLDLNKGTIVDITIRWTDKQPTTGRIELVKDGKVIAVRQGTALPGSPVVLTVAEKILTSGWLCARRMDEKGHESHTAPVYLNVDKKPIRASADDAQFFVNWIDNILKNIAPGGKWNSYYTVEPEAARDRYKKARDIYSRIRDEAEKEKREDKKGYSKK
ncbi:CehA/McbA family metallohydrolase [Flavitalea flava]